MAMNDKQHELIHKYLHGRLTAEEEQEWETLQLDPEFQQEVDFQKTLQNIVHTEYDQMIYQELNHLTEKTREEYANLDNAHEAERQNEEKPRQPKISWRWPRILPMAAFIALAIAAGTYLWQTSSTPSFTIEHISLGGASKGESDAETEALQAYEERDYFRAQQLFSQIPETEKSEQDLFFQAMTLLLLHQQDANLEDVTQAISYLEPLSKGEGFYKEMAEWHLALAYLMNHENDKGEALLENIAQGPHPYSEQAQKLLK